MSPSHHPPASPFMPDKEETHNQATPPSQFPPKIPGWLFASRQGNTKQDKNQERSGISPRAAPLSPRKNRLITQALAIHRQNQHIWKDIDPGLREGLARLVRAAYQLDQNPEISACQEETTSKGKDKA